MAIALPELPTDNLAHFGTRDVGARTELRIGNASGAASCEIELTPVHVAGRAGRRRPSLRLARFCFRPDNERALVRGGAMGGMCAALVVARPEISPSDLTATRCLALLPFVFQRAKARGVGAVTCSMDCGCVTPAGRATASSYVAGAWFTWAVNGG